MDHQTILKLIEKGEAILGSNTCHNNPVAIHQLREIAKALLVASENNGVIDQKCSSLMEFAGIAYAPRKSRSYTREDAYEFASRDLYAMRVHTRQLQQVRPASGESGRSSKLSR